MLIVLLNFSAISGVRCTPVFIGQCDFDLCFLDTILHWGHLSLYCDPALVGLATQKVEMIHAILRAFQPFTIDADKRRLPLSNVCSPDIFVGIIYIDKYMSVHSN